MKRIEFIYPTNRRKLLWEVQHHVSPDNALYGANHLKGFGYLVKIHDVSTKLEKLLDILLTPLHRLFRSQIDIDFKLSRAILQYLNLNNTDVIITTTDGIGLAVCLLKRLKLIKPPVIYSVGLFYIQGKLKRSIDANKQTLFLRFYRWLLSSADHILYHSPIEKEKLKKLGLYSPATCTFIAMGSDSHFFKNKQNLISDSKIVLSVGKDRARDYRTLFQAAAQLPTIQFEVVCRKSNILGLQIPPNVNLHFDIPYREVAQLYQRAQIVIIPIKEMQRSSGQMTLTDSFQAEKPVIISNVVGISHYPLQNGANCIKVTPQNVTELTFSIKKLLLDKKLQNTLKKNAVKLRLLYSTVHYAKELKEVIKWILDPFQLQSLSRNNLEFVRKIRNENRHFFLDSGYITKNAQHKWYQRYLESKSDYMFILLNKKEKIGTGAIYNINFEKKEAEIGRFIISAFYRNRGYGKILLKKIEYVANKLNLKKLYLEFLKENDIGANLYRKYGYRQIEVKTVGGKKIIKMTKNLGRIDQ